MAGINSRHSLPSRLPVFKDEPLLTARSSVADNVINNIVHNITHSRTVRPAFNALSRSGGIDTARYSKQQQRIQSEKITLILQKYFNEHDKQAMYADMSDEEMAADVFANAEHLIEVLRQENTKHKNSINIGMTVEQISSELYQLQQARLCAIKAKKLRAMEKQRSELLEKQRQQQLYNAANETANQTTQTMVQMQLRKSVGGHSPQWNGTKLVDNVNHHTRHDFVNQPVRRYSSVYSNNTTLNKEYHSQYNSMLPSQSVSINHAGQSTHAADSTGTDDGQSATQATSHQTVHQSHQQPIDQRPAADASEDDYTAHSFSTQPSACTSESPLPSSDSAAGSVHHTERSTASHKPSAVYSFDSSPAGTQLPSSSQLTHLPPISPEKRQSARRHSYKSQSTRNSSQRLAAMHVAGPLSARLPVSLLTGMQASNAAPHSAAQQTEHVSATQSVTQSCSNSPRKTFHVPPLSLQPAAPVNGRSHALTERHGEALSHLHKLNRQKRHTYNHAESTVLHNVQNQLHQPRVAAYD